MTEAEMMNALIQSESMKARSTGEGATFGDIARRADAGLTELLNKQQSDTAKPPGALFGNKQAK